MGIGLENHSYSAGIRINVNSVEEARPNTTTTASGLCTSEPIPEDNNNGTRPKTVVTAVMRTGRNRVMHASTNAS